MDTDGYKKIQRGSEENGLAEMLSKASPFELGYLPTAPDYLNRF